MRMITNLFSVFDPSTRIWGVSLNWVSSGLGLLMVPYIF